MKRTLEEPVKRQVLEEKSGDGGSARRRQVRGRKSTTRRRDCAVELKRSKGADCADGEEGEEMKDA